ncbi:hypothetical protein AG1IA_04287 [Rhizoctonia solani AG-1 IA]|uniref:Uncharacterized protein n=1 Tax=Thanatephorus cucumeris (strain AG1-IA) TaxID=983506 RepID=L8WZ71_THACA|nr:hypothetical protein AG1IA_04287 [Rhizoctonia solani AG-1 IA]
MKREKKGTVTKIDISRGWWMIKRWMRIRKLLPRFRPSSCAYLSFPLSWHDYGIDEAGVMVGNKTLKMTKRERNWQETLLQGSSVLEDGVGTIWTWMTMTRAKKSITVAQRISSRSAWPDSLCDIAKHDSTRAFVDMYDKAIKSTEDDEFAHLNQVTEDIDVAPGMNEDEEDDEEGEEGEEVGVEEEEATAPETPFGHSKKYIPSSEKAEVSFGFKPPNFNHDNDSDEEDPATIDLPDAVPQKLAPVTRGNSVASRIQQWAVQEGGGNRANIGRMGQGVSVTGHGGKNKVTKTKSASSNRPSALAGTSSSSSNKLSRLGSKASGFR